MGLLTFLSLTAVAVGLLLLWFFRDPEREPDKKFQDLLSQGGLPLLASADGKVTDITENETAKKIGIFLSILDCHVQRSPLEGRVIEVKRKEGKFWAAFHPKAASQNASVTITIENPAIGQVVVRQIAGLLARRILTRVGAGDSLKAGQRLGMILLGSRVELEVPKSVKMMTQIGDHVYAGKTVVSCHGL